MRIIALAIFIASLLISGCNSQNDKENTENIQNQTQLNPQVLHVGVVEDFMDAGDYTYVQLSENNDSYWIAIPKTEVAKGEKLTFSEFIEMQNFESKTLNKTFESVLFVQNAQKVADEKTLQNAHSNVLSKKNEEIEITPLEDGKTISQIYEEKDNLNGNQVKVRGKVVKYNGGIMNRNWIHIQDGTNFNGNYDLLVTSNQTAKVGDLIVAEGTLTTDKDFGAGYFYPVVVENAKVEEGK